LHVSRQRVSHERPVRLGCAASASRGRRAAATGRSAAGRARADRRRRREGAGRPGAGEGGPRGARDRAGRRVNCARHRARRAARDRDDARGRAQRRQGAAAGAPRERRPAPRRAPGGARAGRPAGCVCPRLALSCCAGWLAALAELVCRQGVRGACTALLLRARVAFLLLVHAELFLIPLCAARRLRTRCPRSRSTRPRRSRGAARWRPTRPARRSTRAPRRCGRSGRIAARWLA